MPAPAAVPVAAPARADFDRYDRLAISSYLEAQSPGPPDLRVLASERPGQVIRFHGHGEEPSDGLTNFEATHWHDAR